MRNEVYPRIPYPEIRNDDILQTTDTLTAAQKSDLRGRSMFEAFLEADSVFDRYSYPCTLAVIAEGVRDYPQWVRFIRNHSDRYHIQLHGFTHRNYALVGRKKFVFEIGMAKKILEETFEVPITVWYAPWGRKGVPTFAKEVCEHLGLCLYEQTGKVDAKLWFRNPQKYTHVNFHFWNDAQVEHVKRILCQLIEKPSKDGSTPNQ